VHGEKNRMALNFYSFFTLDNNEETGWCKSFQAAF
jgi:hypothetical protein